jgi:2-phospho-L-lactate transferase/gluconeogenesis factor (CofD/UPF0052 family)
VADTVILSPGSLFTRTIPALLGTGVREALAGFAGPVIYVANVMTQPGETTDMLVHSGGLSRELVGRYATEGAVSVEVDRKEIDKLGVRLREADLFSDQVGTTV